VTQHAPALIDAFCTRVYDVTSQRDKYSIAAMPIFEFIFFFVVIIGVIVIARLSFNTASELGFRGSLDEWERLMGAVARR
jgi:hypothetical protein